MMNSKIRALTSAAVAASLLVACTEPDRPSAAAQSTADTPSDELVEYLFVQHAQKVALENGVLTLVGVGNEVLYFSDRPDRIVGRETLAAFIDDWDVGEESFATIPPNAIVTVVRDSESLDLAVVLSEPTMIGDRSMTYNVEVLDGPASGVGENAAVFIDAFGHKPGGESRLGRPGRPGDPDKLRNAAEAQVKGKRGRDGKRNIQKGDAEKLDRVL